MFSGTLPAIKIDGGDVTQRAVDSVSRRRFLRGVGATAAIGAGSVGTATRPVLADDGDSDVTKTDTAITSSDGTTIKLSVFEPPGESPHPAVFSMQGGVSRRGSQESRARALAGEGYVALTYDPRGIAPSGGEWDAGGEKDIEDISALIDFLRDGNADVDPAVETDGDGEPIVGMEGGSAGGWRAIRAASQDDRIDAITGVITPYDASKAIDTNGVLRFPWAFFLNFAINVPWVTTPDDPDLTQVARETIETKEPVEEFVTWFEERSVKNGIEDVTTPTLIINGWHDRAFPPKQTYDLYEGLSNADERRLAMIDFIAHDFEGSPDPSPTEGLHVRQARTQWLAKHLEDEDLPDGSPVTGDPIDFYDAQADEFDSYAELPTGTESFALGDAKQGDTTALKTTGDGRPHRTAFEFSVDEDLDLAGVGNLSLAVTPTGGDPHLFAALEDVPPADSDEDPVHIKDQIAAMEVTDTGTVEIDIGGVERTVSEGHTLRLVLTLDDDELNDFPDRDGPLAPAFTDGLYVDSDQPAGLTIHHSRGRSSTLDVTTETD